MPHDRDDNPLGLGSRGRESANTGSTADTSYDAVDSDPYETGEPRKATARDGATQSGGSTPVDPDVPSSNES